MTRRPGEPYETWVGVEALIASIKFIFFTPTRMVAPPTARDQKNKKKPKTTDAPDASTLSDIFQWLTGVDCRIPASGRKRDSPLLTADFNIFPTDAR